jgi:hypothetical protein
MRKRIIGSLKMDYIVFSPREEGNKFPRGTIPLQNKFLNV